MISDRIKELAKELQAEVEKDGASMVLCVSKYMEDDEHYTTALSLSPSRSHTNRILADSVREIFGQWHESEQIADALAVPK